MSHCKESGLPRRFAPRNDRGDVLALAGTLPRSAHLARQTSLHPRTRPRLLHVIANQCAHWCGNPFSPQGNLASRYYFGQIRMHFPVFALGAALCFVLPQENGLPRRFAPRNDRGEVSLRTGALQPLTPGMFPRTLRAASLQPLTRVRLQHVIANHPLQPLTRHRLLHVIANQCAHWCGNPHPRRETLQIGCCLGKFVVLFGFAQSIAFRFALLRGERIATSLRSSQ